MLKLTQLLKTTYSKGYIVTHFFTLKLSLSDSVKLAAAVEFVSYLNYLRSTVELFGDS